MRRYAVTALLAALALGLGAIGFADEMVPPGADQLFGVTPALGAQGQKATAAELAALYDKSGATAVPVQVIWRECEPEKPAGETRKYDFSKFDADPFVKIAKTKMCSIWFENSWAAQIDRDSSGKFADLAGDFVKAFAKHANERGIYCFRVAEYSVALGGTEPTPPRDYLIRDLKIIYKALKEVSDRNLVIADGHVDGSDESVQRFYDRGARGLFDVLEIRAAPTEAKQGIDAFRLVSAHRAMARNGDDSKKLFVTGWGPVSSVTDQAEQLDLVRSCLANGYRNLMTDRDIYDPRWIAGALYLPLNDHIEGNAKPTTAGLVDIDGKPKDDLLADFPPKIPQHKFEGKISAEGPIFNYIVGKPYKLALVFTNQTGSPVSLDKFGVSVGGNPGISVEAKPEGQPPTSVAIGETATANFDVTFPDSSARKQITLVGELDYSVGDKKHFTDCWVTVMPAPAYEITLLPGRLILDPNQGEKRVGMSVINHSEQPFDGKVAFSAPAGIEVKPAQVDMKIDPQGLEACVFTVTAAAKLAPGHYAVYVDVGGKGKDWVAVDVPVVAAKPSGKIAIDGKLDDWTGAAAAPVTLRSAGVDQATIGTAMFAYDDKAFYAAFTIDEPKHTPIAGLVPGDGQGFLRIGIDTLVNGARTALGGYREDDYEYDFADTKAGPEVARTQAPTGTATGPTKSVQFAFRNAGGKSVYEIAIPWAELKPFAMGKGKVFAIAAAVALSEGARTRTAEWGGGIAGQIDPRKFIPVVLNAE